MGETDISDVYFFLPTHEKIVNAQASAGVNLF